MKIRLIALILLLPAAAHSQTAQRDPGTPWEAAASRVIPHPSAGSAYAQAQDPANLVTQVTDATKFYPWPGSMEELNQAFALARDSRVIPWRPDFIRRPSWLYPDDGCFARAGVAADTLKQAGLPVPGKIFAFGNLTARTPRSPSGSVSWWYHVAVAYRHLETLYVFDPAIEERRPLTAQEWMERIGGANARIRLSLCHTMTYNPNDDCQNGGDQTTTWAFRDQIPYLNLEWNRLVNMGSDPYALLGDLPPWK